MKTKLLLASFIFSFHFLHAGSINKPVSSQQGFIENKGQIIDQNNNLNPSVLYLYNGNGLHVQLKQTGFSYEVWKLAASHQPLASGKLHERNNLLPEANSQQLGADSIYIHRIDISFVGANPNAKITSYEPSKDYINYYTTGTTEKGVTNVRHFKKVLYENIYNNIDVEFCLSVDNSSPSGSLPAGQAGLGGAFKYNFIVHPGGNPNDIQLKYDGANNTSLTNDGHITIETAYGNIDESIPLTYQIDENNTQQNVNATYKFLSTDNQQASTTFGFNVGTYDHSKTLIIDPISWATYYGGIVDVNEAHGIACDANGNVFITGETGNSSSIATSGAYQTTLLGYTDAFVSMFDSTGFLQWGTYYGGSAFFFGNGNAHTIGYAINLDINRNILVIGYTTSQTSIASTGAYQTTGCVNGDGDAFLVKFNSSGIRQWGTYFGGGEYDIGESVNSDVLGNIIIGGATESSGIATSGAYQTTNSIDDGFLAKFDSNGTIQWATYYGGTITFVLGIASDIVGNILITGETNSTSLIATSGAYQLNLAGGKDAFIAKFSTSGSIIWSTYFGGSGSDYGKGIACDKNGDILITGSTNSDSAIATSGAFQTSLSNGDAFIAKFDSSGLRKWATYFGGNWSDAAQGIALDGNGNIFIAGETNSTSSMATVGAYQAFGAVFLTKFDSTGYLQWSTCYGGENSDFESGIAVDSLGDVFITGWTSSTTGIATPGSYQSVYPSMGPGAGGYYDAFIAVFKDSGTLIYIPTDSISKTQSICRGTAPDTLKGSILNGRNYEYQWQKSTISSTSGFVNAGGNDSSLNYISTAIYSDTWFRRIAFLYVNYSDTSNVIVVKLIHNGFTLNSSSQCLGGNPFLLNDTSTLSGGTISHHWNFGTGTNDTSSLINPSKTYSSTGAYTVQLISTSTNGCNDTVSRTINVNAKPNTGFTINNSSQCVNANNFIFTDTTAINSGFKARLWSFSNDINDTSTNANPTKIYSTSGTQIIKLVLDNGCLDSVSKTVTIKPSPIVGFTINKTSQCLSGNNFLFTDTSSFTSGTITDTWDFGNGTTSTASSPIKSYVVANDYQVKLVSVGSNGCNDSMIQTVKVHPSPNVNFTQNQLAACLTGNNFTLNDSSTIAWGQTGRMWKFGDGTTSTDANPSKSFTNGGNYQIKLIITSNYNCKDSLTKTFTVKANPAKPSITALSSSLLQSTVANSYQWYLNNAIISSATNQTLAITINGNYSVKIDSTNGCGNLSNPFAAASVGVNEVSVNTEMKIYPNPASDVLNIVQSAISNLSAGQAGQQLAVSILDALGKTVLEPITFNNSVTINTSSLSEGMYFVRITDANSVVVKMQKVAVVR